MQCVCVCVCVCACVWTYRFHKLVVLLQNTLQVPTSLCDVSTEPKTTNKQQQQQQRNKHQLYTYICLQSKQRNIHQKEAHLLASRMSESVSTNILRSISSSRGAWQKAIIPSNTTTFAPYIVCCKTEKNFKVTLLFSAHTHTDTCICIGTLYLALA